MVIDLDVQYMVYKDLNGNKNEFKMAYFEMITGIDTGYLGDE